MQNIPAFNQIVIPRIVKNQAEIKAKKNGALLATLRDKISSDRKESTSTTVQPGHEDQIRVWERSGGMHDVANPFIPGGTHGTIPSSWSSRMRARSIQPTDEAIQWPTEIACAVSPDGQQMTLTTTGVLGTGEQIEETLVFRKQ